MPALGAEFAFSAVRRSFTPSRWIWSASQALPVFSGSGWPRSLRTKGKSSHFDAERGELALATSAFRVVCAPEGAYPRDAARFAA